MPPADRNHPDRARTSDARFTLLDFMREFPDDATCLDWLWRNQWSADGEHAYCKGCKQERRFHRVKGRPSYDCDACGYHIHPTANTIFHKSSTSLHLWFYAMYLMTSTKCGVSAKHLERELGVTYKTAWRMANRIRNVLMADDTDEPDLGGTVELDETNFGGKPRAGGNQGKPRKRGPKPQKPKTVAFAAVERGGKVRATVVPDDVVWGQDDFFGVFAVTFRLSSGLFEIAH